MDCVSVCLLRLQSPPPVLTALSIAAVSSYRLLTHTSWDKLKRLDTNRRSSVLMSSLSPVVWLR